MRTSFLVLLLTVLAGSEVVAEPRLASEGGGASVATQADRDAIAAAIFRYFLNGTAVPEEEARIYYVGGDDGHRLNLAEFSDPSYVLKRGKGCVLQGDVVREEKTGKLCMLVSLKVVSVKGDSGVGAVESYSGPLGFAGLALELKKARGVWKVVRVIGSGAS